MDVKPGFTLYDNVGMLSEPVKIITFNRVSGKWRHHIYASGPSPASYRTVLGVNVNLKHLKMQEATIKKDEVRQPTLENTEAKQAEECYQHPVREQSAVSRPRMHLLPS